MHPYERLFYYLRRFRDGWEVNDEGMLRRYCCCPLEAISGSSIDSGTDLLKASKDQQTCIMSAADGCAYAGCGYEDLARKLHHYLGVTR